MCDLYVKILDYVQIVRYIININNVHNARKRRKSHDSRKSAGARTGEHTAQGAGAEVVEYMWRGRAPKELQVLRKFHSALYQKWRILLSDL